MAGLNSSLLQEAISLHREGRLADAASLYLALLAQQPEHAEALHLLGVIELQRNNSAGALELIDRAIKIDAANAAYFSNRGVALQGLMRLDDALASYDSALALDPHDADAHLNRGNALRALARFEDALAGYDRALAIAPGRPEAHINRGIVLRDLKRFDDALAGFDQALAIKPDDVNALLNRGNVLLDLKRFEEALADTERALEIWPDYADAFNNRGVVLEDLKRFEEALASFDRALAVRPDYADALINRGNTLQDLRRFDDALASYDKAMALAPGNAKALNNRGNALAELRRFDEALASFDRALAIAPHYAEAHYGRGNALGDLKRFGDALASFDRALAARPEYVEALNGRGNALADMRRFDEAYASYGRALAIAPDFPFLFGVWLHAKMTICEWRGLAADFARLAERIAAGQKASDPFPVLATPLSADLQKTNAQIYVREKCPPNSSLPPLGRRYDRARIRLGYFSADFHNHATAHLIAGLIEHHDRTRFEVTAFSIGPPVRDAMRTRLERSFDRFIEARARSDKDIALLARGLEIDIAVDLKGFTQDSRTGIFALRAAPIQVNYLGYPGTMGAGYIDYLIADALVIPEDQRQHYAEKIAYLPDTYQSNDATLALSGNRVARAEHGLPEEGFVFCCFNNNYKITPEIFAVWMRLLARVAGSVLWLLEDNATAADNLRAEAQSRGIAPERIHFAKRIDLSEHLARHRLADLFLDTMPYNAHTTASDALRAGLPILTCLGKTFPGRVAASLLTAIGLPELITLDLDAYESLALDLAENSEKLRALRRRLADNRSNYPLFDTARFTRHIESAYAAMWARHRAGLPPDHIYVQSGSDSVIPS